MTYIYALAVVFVVQTLFFIIATLRRNNGIADIGWGVGFIALAYLSLTTLSSWCVATIGSRTLVFILVAIWGLRLSVYLFIRNWSKAEDWRYAKWREEWGRNVLWRSYLQVFLLQGLFMLVIASTFLIHADAFVSTITAAESTYIMYQYIGVAIWLIGFFFQAVGDYQLFVFKKDPAHQGRIMRYGLWRYTRHPNYFGESTMWWGIFVISCSSAFSFTDILLRAVGPATITFLLLRVSGVTMLERKYEGNEEYLDYQRRTSAFLPQPPRK